MVRASVLVLLMALGLAGCGADDGAASEPVTTPTVLRLVATPSVGSVDSGARVEAVVAYPERVTASLWQACVLLVDDAADPSACPLPLVQLYGDTLFRARVDSWTLRSVGDLGVPLFEALSQVASTDAAAAPPAHRLDACALQVVAAWDACVASSGGWPDQCVYEADDRLRACVQQGGTDVRVHYAATLDDGSTLKASRRLSFLKTGSPPIGNRNPVLFNVVVDGVNVPEGQALQVPVGSTLLLQAIPFAESSETYTTAAGTTATERLQFSWVRTAGDLDVDLTPSDDPFNALFVPESALGVPLALWVFFEDDRGGIDWAHVAIDPVPTP
jgi:hypothetical protein